jgi:hypothetical protein
MRLLFITVTTIVTGTLLLSGCGGSSGDNASNPPVASKDTFVQTVRQYTDTASASSDSSEPNDITNVMVTMPDNSEPEMLVF